MFHTIDRIPGPIRPIGALLLLLALVGCTAGGPPVYESVQGRRAEAYTRWYKGHLAMKEAQVRLQGQLSLSDAIGMGLAYNKSLQATVLDREIARGRVVEAWSEVLPRVTAIAGYNRLDEVATFDVGPQEISLGFEDNYSVDLQVTQPLFRGPRAGAALRGARVLALLSDETVRGATHGTIHEVARGYLDVLLAQRLHEVYEEAVRSAQAQLVDVEHKSAQGMASRFDVLRSQVEVATFKAEMIRHRNGVSLARARLLKSMGVSQESMVMLSDKLVYQSVKPELETAVRTAFENRPELFQAELGVLLQQEAVRATRSAYWPSVDAVFTERFAKPDPHDSTSNDWGDSWTFGVSMTWPIFDGMSREGRMIQERAALDKKKVELLAAQEDVLLQVRQAVLSLVDAEEFVDSQRLNINRAGEALRLAEVGYRQGVNTRVEVTEARAALTRAMGLQYQAIHGHVKARLELQRAMGVLGPKAGEAPVRGDGKLRPLGAAGDVLVTPPPAAGE